jgi:pyruvate/2-oxoglutarate/acetoin dehydrogenase E1 component
MQLYEAHDQVMENDDRVFLSRCEDIGVYGGRFWRDGDLQQKIWQRTGISIPLFPTANHRVACVFGAAITGMRPVGEIMFSDFRSAF